MKKSFCLITLSLTLLSCSQLTLSGKDKHKQSTTESVTKAEVDCPRNSIHPSKLFTLHDAEKILGEPAHLADSSSTVKGEASKYSAIDSVSIIKKQASTYHCAYIANANDRKTEKTGTIYFVCEQYPEVSLAKEVYSFYKKANEKNNGLKELHGMGDEAWSKNNPLFIYVRKCNKIFVMKVSRKTNKTSSDEFKLVAKKITDAL